MIHETVTYTDFNGRERVEDCYFHLTQAELLQMEIGAYTADNPAGFSERIQQIIDSQNGKEIVELFKSFMDDSYGIKTPDGRFEKSPEILARFKSTEAYSQLFTRMATDTGFGEKFVNGLVAPVQAQQAQNQQAGVQKTSQQIRDEAAARMQGYQQPQQAAQQPFQQVPYQEPVQELQVQAPAEQNPQALMEAERRELEELRRLRDEQARQQQ